MLGQENFIPQAESREIVHFGVEFPSLLVAQPGCLQSFEVDLPNMFGEGGESHLLPYERDWADELAERWYEAGDQEDCLAFQKNGSSVQQHVKNYDEWQKPAPRDSHCHWLIDIVIIVPDSNPLEKFMLPTPFVSSLCCLKTQNTATEVCISYQ